MAEIFWASDVFQALGKKREEYDAETEEEVQSIKCSSWPAERYLREILVELVRARRDRHRP